MESERPPQGQAMMETGKEAPRAQPLLDETTAEIMTLWGQMSLTHFIHVPHTSHTYTQHTCHP